MTKENKEFERAETRKLRFESMFDDRRFWSESEVKKLTGMFTDGYDITEIAKELLRSETAIIQKLEALDMFKNRKKRNSKKQKPEGCLCPECVYKLLCESANENGKRVCHE